MSWVSFYIWIICFLGFVELYEIITFTFFHFEFTYECRGAIQIIVRMFSLKGNINT